MNKIYIRKIQHGDKQYFAKWWRDKELLKLTSGILKMLSDKEVDKYFKNILESKKDYHFIIILGRKVVGHIALAKRQRDWYETQIVIGEKRYWGKGYGSEAIKLLMQKVKHMGISKVYLEVRPTNMRAICAYEHCGFKKARMVLYPKNRHLPETVRMELR